MRVLGAGNFGIVYEAENIHLDETLAIKEFLPTELARREEDGQIRPLSPATAEAFRWARERFLQEARTLWGLGHPRPHPSIVRVTRYQEANGSAYMFMEFERGQPLSDLLEQRGSLTYEELRPLIAALLDGLERVHAANILHRDIKPANILIRPDGSPVFIDFGAARNVALSGETSVFTTFTPRYAALEQHDQSSRQGPWTDIYALGATLYHAVTGITPKSASEQLLGQPQEPAAILGRGRYPDAFLHAIDAACALRPEDRPQTAAAWRRRLFGDGALEAEATVLMPQVSATDATRLSRIATEAAPFGRQTATSGPAALGTAPPSQGRKPMSSLGWIALVVTLGGLSGLTGWLWWSQKGEPKPSAESGTPRPIAGPAERPVTDQLPGSVAPSPAKVAAKPGPLPPGEARPTAEPLAPTEPETPIISEAPTTPAVMTEPQTGAKPEVPIPDKSARAPRVIPPLSLGQRFADPLASGGTGPMMIVIPPGEFTLGSAPAEAGHRDDERPYLARIAGPFALSQTEITIGQFAQFTQGAGYRTEADRESACLRVDDAGVALVTDLSLSWERPGYPVTDQHPVTCVTWNDANAYTQWLSEQTGRTYRLPTEEEWEYAARAATSTSRYWGDDVKNACQNANTADETVLDEKGDTRRITGARAACRDGYVYSAPVGTYAANPLGLKDVIGNVAEWTCSVYDSGYSGAQRQCLDMSRRSGPAPMVLRGGSWLSSPDLSRAAARDGLPSNLSLNTIGFRVLAAEQPQSGTPAGD